MTYLCVDHKQTNDVLFSTNRQMWKMWLILCFCQVTYISDTVVFLTGMVQVDDVLLSADDDVAADDVVVGRS